MPRVSNALITSYKVSDLNADDRTSGSNSEEDRFDFSGVSADEDAEGGEWIPIETMHPPIWKPGQTGGHSSSGEAQSLVTDKDAPNSFDDFGFF